MQKLLFCDKKINSSDIIPNDFFTLKSQGKKLLIHKLVLTLIVVTIHLFSRINFFRKVI